MNTFMKQFRNGTIFPWERDFTRETLNVAIPIVVQTLFMALLHIIDNVMIGRLGEIELAAVTQANRVTFLYELILFGLSSGTAAFVAQYWGKRDLAGIHSVMGIALSLSIVASLCFLLPCTLIPNTLMRLLLDDETAIAAAVEYLPVISIGYVLMALSQCFITAQKSTEQARLPMAAGITALTVNTFLNYCLIFGNFGFPRLGVRGGAIATVIASAVEMILVVGLGYALKLPSAARPSALIPRSAAFVKKYLYVAAPVILNEGLWSLAMVMYSVVYGRMGTSTVAAVSIFNTVEQIAFSVSRGLTHACAVLVGKRIGAGDETSAYNAARRMIYAGIPCGIFAGLLLLLVSMPLISIFNVSERVAQDAQLLVRICAFSMWLHQLAGLLVVGIMRAGGDVRMSLYIDAGVAWLVGVPLVAISGLVMKLDIPYVYLLAQIETIVKVIIGLRRFQSGKWIHNLVK